MENIKNYVDDSEYEKLSSKVLKLENHVKKLNLENNSLRAKVNNLENIVEKICSNLKIQNNLNNSSTNVNDSTTKSNNFSYNENKNIGCTDDLEETWLYFVSKGISKEKIEKKLVLSNEALLIELKVENWLDENKLLVDLLNSFPKFTEFSEDWSSMNNKQLKHFLQTILSSTLVSDTAIILRNLPGKQCSNYDAIMSNIATVAELMYSTWEELEVNNELIGKMALVLESDEELQIMNIIKNNSRLILIVEPLF